MTIIFPSLTLKYYDVYGLGTKGKKSVTRHLFHDLARSSDPVKCSTIYRWWLNSWGKGMWEMIMLRSQSMWESSQGSSGSRGEKERESTRAPTSPPRSEAGAVVRALHQCDPGSDPGVKAICGVSFSPLFREVFLEVLRFPPPHPLKNQDLQIPIWSGMHRDISASSHELFRGASWVNK